MSDAKSVRYRLMTWLFGYDVFIAYRHDDARAYASALRSLLKEQGLTVFLDVANEGEGGEIEALPMRACASRAFVALATRGLFDSKDVRKELEAYRNQRFRGWRRRIVPVTDCMEYVKSRSDKPWRELGAHVLVSESTAAFKEGNPSDKVVAKIVDRVSFVRTTRLMVLFFVVFVAFLLAGLYSTLRLINKRDAIETVRQSQKLRLEAQKLLANDPVRAFRLAEAAEDMHHDSDNDSLLRDAMSAWEVPYRDELTNCTIDDVIGVEALVRCGPVSTPHLEIYDAAAGRRRALAIPAGREASLVGEETTRRILVEYEVGDGSSGTDHRRRYQLYGTDGGAIGAPLSEPWTERRAPCSRALAVIHESATRAIRWDLAHDTRTPVEIPICSRVNNSALPPACKLPRSAIVPRCGGIGVYRIEFGDELPDVPGMGPATAEEVGGFRFGVWRIEWSADGDAIALLAPDERSDADLLRVDFDPSTSAATVSITGVTAFAWSPSGHELVYARPGGAAAFELYFIDSDHQETVVTFDGIVRGLAFSPDAKKIAVLGDVDTAVIDRVGAVVARLRHPGASSVHWLGDRILTAREQDAGGEVRVWSLATERLRWRFESATQTYSECAAGDPRSRWLAVQQTGLDGHRSVMLHALAGGADRVLAVSSSNCNELSFTPDGEWLLLLADEGTTIWSTRTWVSQVVLAPDPEKKFAFATGVDATVWLVLAGDGQRFPQRLDLSRWPTVTMRAEADFDGPTPLCQPSDQSTSGWHYWFGEDRGSTFLTMRCGASPWTVRTACASDRCVHEFIPLDLQVARRLLDQDFARFSSAR